MEEVAHNLFVVFLIAVASAFIGFGAVLFESQSFDSFDNALLCAGLISVSVFVVFIVMYVNYEHKKTIRKEEEERRRIINEPRNRFNQIHLEYPKSSSIVYS